MSLKSQARAVCQKCGHERVVDIYKSINSETDPELKAAVMDGSAFLWECPDCGTSNLLAYECLYHDPKDKYMVWMLPFGEPEGPEKDAIMNQTRSMGDYRLRVVSNAGDLMEKVIIFDAGLDDRCMELVKYVAGNEMPDVTNLHFYRIQDDVMVFSGIRKRSGGDDSKGAMEGFGFGLNVYEDCRGILQRNADLATEDGFAHIDANWVASILK